MEHVAIDLGGRESQICVRDGKGEIVLEDRWPTRSLKKFLGKRPPSRVVVETCAEAFGVADVARALGHQVVVVPATLAPSLGVGERGLKTDVRDARNLSSASCRMERLPSVHVPSAESRERKSMCGAREALIKARTTLINTIRGWLRSQALGVVPRGSAEAFALRFREHVKAKAGTVPTHIEWLLETLEQLAPVLAKADAELEAKAEADPTCVRLMTVPGVGPLTAVRFAAAIDEVDRFGNASVVASYFGLTPGERSSSDRRRLRGITKAGSTHVRWALIQAAWSARRWRKNDPMVAWAMAVEERRGKHVAIVALARKMTGILYAIWRDGSTYDRSRNLTTPSVDPKPVQ